jgi:TatA/E family protein of Tat protein translocase
VGLLSIPHLIIIFLVTLVVFGPQKLPELARQLGKALAEFRKATADLRGSFDEHMRELEREARALEQQTREAAKLPEATVPATPEPPPAAIAQTAAPTLVPTAPPTEDQSDAPKT